MAIRSVFFGFPSIGKSLLDEAGSAAELLGGDRARFMPHFLRHEALWRRFLGLGGSELREAESELDRIEALGLALIPINDPRYPALLRQIADPPLALVARGGAIEALSAPVIAMVGSRRASQRAMETGASIAMGLAEAGYTIASGLAYGIDSACHRGAIAGGGLTVAVMGCGPEMVYPPGNARLYQAIAASGVILSEFPIGTAPFRQNFPQRNRVISGIALATVVVEAAEKSGSLITARFALEQNREVMAVPGPGGTAGAKGVNSLIRDGAPLVESADDVAAHIDPLLAGRQFVKISGQLETDVEMDSALLGAVPARGAVSVDEIVARTGMRASSVLARLGELCVAGEVEQLPGRRWRRIRRRTDA
ncbi:MAG: DNA-processing protein DprA [Proteobacteria bacterium]|nr:DNA-processing protein DprA [Pseudomonadota bacterium]